ncbi:MAG: hypothetical protein WC389_14545 [Lutibacter sp.]|jgi:hypothetical protein
MSRSNNTEVVSPAKMFFNWNGDKGGFEYYDKEAEGEEGKKGKKIKAPFPFKFLVLDCLHTVKGFSDIDQSGFWSNEVRDLKKDEIIVKNKKGICARGLYEHVISDKNCAGAKYCQSVYVAYKDENQLVIANIQMYGAAVSSWFSFISGKDIYKGQGRQKIYDGAISVNEFIEGKKGKTIYQIPIFTKINVREDTEEQAKLLDEILQEYLKLYFHRNNTKENDEIIEKVVKNEDPPVEVEAGFVLDEEREPAAF